MDVDKFLLKVQECISVLYEASELTTHQAEKDLLFNFGRCIERQIPQKYRKTDD